MEYWDFWMLALAVLPNFSQFTKELENVNFQEKKCSKMFMQNICANLSTENTMLELKWGQKLQNCTRYSDASVNGSLSKPLRGV